MTSTYSILFVLLSIALLLVLSSCNSEKPDPYAHDTHGIVEAEELGGQPKRLIKCSQDEDCPEYTQALFWVAADILSEASAEVSEINEDGLGLTKGMSIKEIMAKLGPQLENLIEGDTPEYDFKDPEFRRGLALMHKAHDAGSAYASNELGLLFMEQSELQNLILAEMYLKTSLNMGDMMSAYNLARLVHMQNPEGNKRILEYLKIASQSNIADMETVYFLGLEAFGSKAEKLTASNYLKENKAAVRTTRNEFERHFELEVSIKERVE